MSGNATGAKKIGILGGTFDPIHLGHLILATEAYERFSLDTVWFMPSGNPPHKQQQPVLEAAHRVAMVQAAIANNPHFVYSDFELKRSGTIYTAETLTLLTQTYSKNSYYFIVGADSLFQIEKWYQPAEIFSHCTLLAAGRNNFIKEKLQEQIWYLTQKYNARIQLLPTPLIEISSTRIREKVADGEEIRYYVPDAVEEYIQSHHLYQRRE